MPRRKAHSGQNSVWHDVQHRIHASVAACVRKAWQLGDGAEAQLLEDREFRSSSLELHAGDCRTVDDSRLAATVPEFPGW